MNAKQRLVEKNNLKTKTENLWLFEELKSNYLFETLYENGFFSQIIILQSFQLINTHKNNIEFEDSTPYPVNKIIYFLVQLLYGQKLSNIPFYRSNPSSIFLLFSICLLKTKAQPRNFFLILIA